mmetsp:Transcript_28281/g.41952  ORF Transcript_28281/g.41952 Transcript_28281/m.41952 type:complete len:175 (+) Transcript_28281:854-1378(+)
MILAIGSTIESLIEVDHVVTIAATEDPGVDPGASRGAGDPGGAAVMIEIVEGVEEVEVQGDRQGTVVVVVEAVVLATQKMHPLLLAEIETGNANRARVEQMLTMSMLKEGKTGAAVVACHLRTEALRLTGIKGKGARAIDELGAKVEIEIQDPAKGVLKAAGGARKGPRDVVGV